MTTKLIQYDSDRPRVRVLYFDGKLTDISTITTSVKISGDVAKAFRSCTISFTNTVDGKKRLISPANGKELRIVVGTEEVFRGIIFGTTRTDSGEESVTAHDYNVYLAKNSLNVKYVKKTAAQIISDVCEKINVPIGGLAKTGYVIPRFIGRQKSAFDIIIMALTMTQKATGKRYMLRSTGGKLFLDEVRPAKEWIRYESGRNLIDATFSESIEDVKTRIEYTGGDENKPHKTVVSGDTVKYGVMQHAEHDSDATSKQLPALAKALLAELSQPSREMSITVLGMPDMLAGKAVIVSDVLTDIRGTYFVLADSHSFDVGGVHTMSLTLSKTLDLPLMDYEPPDETSKTNGGKGGKETSATKGIAATALSYVGKLKYAFGGKNIAGGSGDCSGFTYEVFKKNGINIGHGTSTQLTKGTPVTKSQAKAGDLVFFQGTYRKGVSHVGVVTRRGYCVSLASSGCKEHSYSTGYWGGHFMQIRRVT